MGRLAALTNDLTARWRSVPALVMDAGIALLCYFATTIGHAMEAQPSDRAPVILLLAALSTVPLLWRRRVPLLVALFCGAGSLGLSTLQVPIDLPYGQLVATYTVAALAGPLQRFAAAVLTALGIIAAVLLEGKSVATLLIVSMLFIVAYALGTGARARRDRISLLEERTRRLAEEQDAAAARERERIARDMHDILAHSISIIAIQAEAGPLLVRSDPARAERSFDVISETAHDTLAQLRRTLGMLRGVADDREPQPDLAGVTTLADQARETGLAVRVRECGEPRPVPPELAVATYRVVQESLTNVLRHAHAARVEIGLDWRADALTVEIADDGRGATPDNDVGHGLIGMRERVAACGGTLRTGTGLAGGGFKVSATMPLRSDAAMGAAGADND